jgi:hypothetical protein
VRWLLQFRKAPDAIVRVARVALGGGPSRLRVRGITQPSGLLIPSSRLRLEVEARNGETSRWEPQIPLPFPYAWAYRVARWLRVPVISSHDPEDLVFTLRLPRSGKRD